MACLYMRNKNVKLLVLMGLLLLGVVLFGTSAMAEDPISRTIEITPKVLTGTGTVRVSINITNLSDDGGAVSVTLFDPNGEVCGNFGSGGTANLSPGASASFSGNWTVSQTQLDAGKITYTARYSVVNEEGMRVQVTRPIAATFSYNTATAQLHIDRFVEPSATVMQGQTVKIRYTIKNTGTIDIKNITIKDPDITSEPAVRALLPVGETAELSYSFVAGSTSKTTHAEISYEYEVNGKTEKPAAKQADPPVTIDVTIANLVIQLTGKQMVASGEKIDLTYVITNKSDLSYEQLKITDKVLGDIDSNLSLGPGKSHQGTKSITVNASETYQLTLTGVDSAGNDVIYQSNQLTVQTTETEIDSSVIGVVPVVMDILIEADRDVIYEQPSPIVFRVKVTNNGANAAENVTIAAVGKTIKIIDRIEPLETVDFLIELSASMAGQFQFTATAKDSSGKDTSVESNIFQITYHEIKEPVTPPPPPPEETEEPFIAAPVDEPTQPPFSVPEQERSGIGSILLYVLGGLLGIIVLSVGVLFFLDQRRNRAGTATASGGSKGQVKVIDSIQRVPHRDYARAPKRGDATKPSASSRGKSARPDPVPVSTVEPDRFGDGDLPPMPVELESEEEPVVRQIDTSGVTKSGESMFKRPKKKPAVLFDVEKENAPANAEKPEPVKSYSKPRNVFDEPSASLEDTNVYDSNYLDRMRSTSPTRASKAQSTVPPVLEDVGTSGGKMTDEQAALMSGSTGQYRLSSKSGSVRGGVRTTSSHPADPDEFARKQKAQRAKPKSLADFYDDDEPETPRKP